MGHVMEHVIIELLNLAGMPTGFGQTREIPGAACTAWCSAAPKRPWPAWRWNRAQAADGRHQ
jgi:hypothetical protein